MDWLNIDWLINQLNDWWIVWSAHTCNRAPPRPGPHHDQGPTTTRAPPRPGPHHEHGLNPDSHSYGPGPLPPSFLLPVSCFLTIQTCYIRCIRVIEFSNSEWVWNAVLDTFSVFLLKSVPEKSIFTNHVSRLRLKVNSIMRIEFCTWK